MAGGPLVLVEQHLFQCAIGVTAPAEDRILLAGLGADVVEPAALEFGHAEVRLLDPSEQLLVQRLLQCPGGRHRGIGPGVFGLQVLQSGRIFAIAQPEEWVHPRITMHCRDMGTPRSARRSRASRRIEG